MRVLRKLFRGLNLRINESKSAVDLAQRCKVLGYSFWVASGKVVKRRVSKKAIKAMQDRVREITQRNRVGASDKSLRNYGATSLAGRNTTGWQTLRGSSASSTNGSAIV